MSPWAIFGLTAALCLGLAAPAVSRPFTLADLFSLERLGAAEITADGRYLVAQVEAGTDQAQRFDGDGFTTSYLGRVKVIDLQSTAPVRDLAPPAQGAGLVAGPLSPEGGRMVLQGYTSGGWDTGIAELASGQVRWLGLPSDLAVFGRSTQWVSEAELLMIAMPPGEPPAYLGAIRQTTSRQTELWRRAAHGEGPTYSLVGSGPGLDIWPQAAAQRLLQVDIKNGVQRTLAAGRFLDFEASPGGRWVAALSLAEPLQPTPDQAVRVTSPGRRRDLLLIERSSGAVWRPLPHIDVQPLMLSWSPSGARLLVLGASPEGRVTLWLIDPQAQTVVAPAEGLVTPSLTTLGAGFLTASAGWLGETPVLRGQPAGDAKARADWFVLGGERARNLTSDLAAPPAAIAAQTTTGLIFTGPEGLHDLSPTGQIRRLGPAGGSPLRPLPLGAGFRFEAGEPPRQDAVWTNDNGVLRRLAPQSRQDAIEVGSGANLLATHGASAVIRRRDAHGVSTIVLARATEERSLFSLNPSLAQITPLKVRPVEHKGPSGQDLTSWYAAPTARAEANRGPPPLIVLPYPGAVYDGPPSLLRADTWAPTPHAALLAAHGFAVLAPSLPGPTREFEPASGLGVQIALAVEAVLAQGLADPHRVALWGHSFGGYGALVAATQSDRYAAVIAQAAKTDLIAGWSALKPYDRLTPEAGPALLAPMGWTETGQGGLGTPPWLAPERYQRNSPLMAADKIQTPVLLIHGDQDFVPLPQAEAMFAALYRQGKAAWLMTLFGEGHLPANPSNISAIYEVVLPWLDLQFEQAVSPVSSNDAPTLQEP